jgi:hypothetical protein
LSVVLVLNSATASTRSVSFRWSDIGADSYDVGWGYTTKATGNPATTLYDNVEEDVGSIASQENAYSYTITGVDNAQDCYFAVRPVNGGTPGNWRAEMWEPAGGWAGDYSGHPSSSVLGVNVGIPTGTSLSNSSTSATSSNNQTFTDTNFTNTFTVNHTGCTFRRCRFNSTSWGTLFVEVANTLIEDCEILGTGESSSTQGLLGGSRCSVRRTVIRECADGVVPGEDVCYDWIWVHTPNAPGDPHVDTFQIQGYGARDLTIRHSHLNISNSSPGEQNAGFYVTAAFGDISRILLDSTRIDGGDAFYTIYCNNYPDTLVGVEFYDCHMSSGSVYPADSPYSTRILTWKNNRLISNNSVISTPSEIDEFI